MKKVLLVSRTFLHNHYQATLSPVVFFVWPPTNGWGHIYVHAVWLLYPGCFLHSYNNLPYQGNRTEKNILILYLLFSIIFCIPLYSAFEDTAPQQCPNSKAASKCVFLSPTWKGQNQWILHSLGYLKIHCRQVMAKCQEHHQCLQRNKTLSCWSHQVTLTKCSLFVKFGLKCTNFCPCSREIDTDLMDSLHKSPSIYVVNRNSLTSVITYNTALLSLNDVQRNETKCFHSTSVWKFINENPPMNILCVSSFLLQLF